MRQTDHHLFFFKLIITFAVFLNKIVKNYLQFVVYCCILFIIVYILFNLFYKQYYLMFIVAEDNKKQTKLKMKKKL